MCADWPTGALKQLHEHVGYGRRGNPADQAHDRQPLAAILRKVHERDAPAKAGVHAAAEFED